MNSTSVALPSVPVLDTSRLVLRGFRADDFEPWLALSRTPAYHRYFGPEAMPAEEVWKLLLRSAGHWVVMGYGFWAVEEKASGRFIGAMGFVNLKRELSPSLGDAPEIGWVLDPALHGQGYASEAVAAVLAWGHARFGPVRTVCIIHPDNAPSMKVAARFGYHEFARTTYHDQPIVLFERAALPAAWPEN
ncbi:GNAT family N-acetyltransferase [Hymenobacter glacialis]|uniref:GNAT family N-acetyltransferase n=1 Tax=Hymenobacter glacialis TaxID=1908236 RepID=A0A1G1T481_9BACT|nr:GNAT family N-acetyltransferase [Hymenobacter glacialis]OGX85674.1 GNAT family N-acetyltransferase [Hymenobacter glacialis]